MAHVLLAIEGVDDGRGGVDLVAGREPAHLVRGRLLGGPGYLVAHFKYSYSPHISLSSTLNEL